MRILCNYSFNKRVLDSARRAMDSLEDFLSCSEEISEEIPDYLNTEEIDCLESSLDALMYFVRAYSSDYREYL